MKFKIKILLLSITLPFGFLYSWGEKGHSLISEKAAMILPEEMNSFRAWGEYLSAHASDPDLRKKTDNSESPKHYIDIDFYKEFLSGNMIQDKDQLVSIYGDSTVTSYGTLPWATLETYNNLVSAFKEKNRDKALIYASDLGHYVADGHQPMHTVVNYDGQFTSQKGVHFRYEVNMVDRNIEELKKITDSSNVGFIEDPLDFIFNYIADANSVNIVLLDADRFAYEMTGSREGDEYYNLLWLRTEYITKLQFKAAEQDLASLIYTAWVNAGKPALNVIN